MFRLDPEHVRETALNNSSRRHAFRALTQKFFVLSALLCLGTTAACGGDDSDDSATEASGGSGGSAATSGTGGTPAIMTPPPPMPVACGVTTCNPPSSPISGLASMFGGGALAGAIPQPQACCLDEAAATCGVSMMAGGACEPLATLDPRCPKADLGMIGSFLGGSVQPCCLDNVCGQDGKIFGRGCVRNSEVMSMLGPIASFGMITFPPNQACDAPAATDDDAGVPDTDAGI
jgi:hypothetical protein